MNKKGTIDSASMTRAAKGVLRFAAQYRVFILFLVISGLYGFIIWRINVLAVATPTQAEVQTAQQENSTPRINQTVVEKMMSLKDNSVRVQTLFEDARNNPFSE